MSDPLDPALREIVEQSEIPLERLRELMGRLQAGNSVTPADLSLVISALGTQRDLLQALVALTQRRERP